MGKTRNTGFSNNAIQYNNGSIAFVSGSTTLLNISSSGAIVTTGTITAQTLVVQTVTSSVSFVTGSTKFGALAANTHQFTGSVYITGSNLNIGGTTITDGHLMNIIGNQSSVNVGVVLNNTNATYSRIYGLTNVNNNFVLYDYTTNATRLSVNASGSMGIGTTNIGTEANLHLGAFSANEGGQLILQRGTSYASASHLDNYQNRFRVMSGNDTTSTAERMSVDMVTGAVLISQGTSPTHSGGNLFMLGNTIFFEGTLSVPSPYNGVLRIDIVYSNWGGNNVAALVDVDILAREWGNLGGIAYGRVYALSSGGANSFNNTLSTAGLTTANGSFSLSSPNTFTLRLTFTPTNNKDYIGFLLKIPASSAGTGTAITSITASIV